MHQEQGMGPPCTPANFAYLTTLMKKILLSLMALISVRAHAQKLIPYRSDLSAGLSHPFSPLLIRNTRPSISLRIGN